MARNDQAGVEFTGILTKRLREILMRAKLCGVLSRNDKELTVISYLSWRSTQPIPEREKRIKAEDLNTRILKRMFQNSICKVDGIKVRSVFFSDKNAILRVYHHPDFEYGPDAKMDMHDPYECSRVELYVRRPFRIGWWTRNLKGEMVRWVPYRQLVDTYDLTLHSAQVCRQEAVEFEDFWVKVSLK